jgi:hypothetical protein
METTMIFVPLGAAMEQLEANDEVSFIKLAKRHNCHFERGGIVRINLPELQRCVEAEFAQMQDAAAKRKTVKKRDRGADLGLIEARLTMYPVRIAAKQDKIKSAEAGLKAADSPYMRHKLNKELKKLREELIRMTDNHQRDQQRREEILHSETEDSESAD